MKNDDPPPAGNNPGPSAIPDRPTLRDYFAVEVLFGLLASEAGEGGVLYVDADSGNVTVNRYEPRHYATLAYKLADAMIAARSAT